MTSVRTSSPPPLPVSLPPAGEAEIDVYPSRGKTVKLAVWDHGGEVIAVGLTPEAAREIAVDLVQAADVAEGLWVKTPTAADVRAGYREAERAAYARRAAEGEDDDDGEADEG
ncbi:hypothetical protein [Zavarzinia sp.]|uniref:hypothetical protein n=1 Tax=Zavarzinia sp. TaxID=2027920 RepID=UPI0035689326